MPFKMLREPEHISLNWRGHLLRGGSDTPQKHVGNATPVSHGIAPPRNFLEHVSIGCYTT